MLQQRAQEGAAALDNSMKKGMPMPVDQQLEQNPSQRGSDTDSVAAPALAISKSRDLEIKKAGSEPERGLQAPEEIWEDGNLLEADTPQRDAEAKRLEEVKKAQRRK